MIDVQFIQGAVLVGFGASLLIWAPVLLVGLAWQVIKIWK